MPVSLTPRAYNLSQCHFAYWRAGYEVALQYANRQRERLYPGAGRGGAGRGGAGRGGKGRAGMPGGWDSAGTDLGLGVAIVTPAGGRWDPAHLRG